MSAPDHSAARQHEAGHNWTVEDLIRYAISVRYDAPVSHSRLVKVIRKAYRFAGPVFARKAIDLELSNRTWAGFERYVNEYADPTGAHAAKNTDLQRWRGGDRG